jgi:hypothetical protein
MNSRRAVVGVMGAGEGASAEAVALAEELGECISARGWVLLTGGRPAGVMAAASRGAARKARNVINVLSADVVMICGGGGRPLILLAVPPLWREFFCSLGEGYRARAIPALRGGQGIYCR